VRQNRVCVKKPQCLQATCILTKMLGILAFSAATNHGLETYGDAAIIGALLAYGECASIAHKAPYPLQPILRPQLAISLESRPAELTKDQIWLNDEFGSDGALFLSRLRFLEVRWI